ncbi:MAG TPA: ABC transporter permease [Alphaproteobacteria bacterium]|nr:ABC transporter permease [Alphaproteobacteria bacterium]
MLEGSVFAVVGLGFALVFRVTDVINLSQGAFCVLGALSAYTFEETLRWPVPLAIAGAVLVTVAYATALGAVTFVPALSRLSHSSMLMLTAGILTLTTGGMLVLWGGDPYSLPPLSGERPVELWGIHITTQGFWIAGTTLVIVLGFWFLFTRTILGKALQACAENPMAARLMGIDVPRMALLSFALAATIASLGGIMIAPIASLQFDSGNYFTISGFISVALGGMGSFIGAVSGGLLLGTAEQVAAGYISSLFSDAFALALLLATLLWRPRGLFTLGRSRRIDVRDDVLFYQAIVRLNGRGAVLCGVAAVAVLMALPLVVSDALLGSLVITGILFIGVLGLDVLMGYAGQVGLCQGAFMAIGGYVAGILSTTYGWPPLAGVLFAVLAALLAALVLAFATLRLRGVYLALGTLAFGLVIDSFDAGMMNVTGGPSGLVGIPPFRIGAFAFDSDRSMYYLVAGLIVVLVLALLGGMRSGFGRALMAIRTDQMAAGALGINVVRYKLAAFAISAVLAALAGSLYAFYFRFLSPEMVGTPRSFEMVTMLIVGGEGTLVGSLLGVALLTLLPTMVQSLALYKTFAEGLLLVLAFLCLPEGMFGGIARLVSRAAVRRRGNRLMAEAGAGREVQ